MYFVIMGLFGFFFLCLIQYLVFRYAINNSEATRLLQEIKVLLMKDQNNNSKY